MSDSTSASSAPAPSPAAGSATAFDLIGVGNPIMDLLVRVPDAFLSAHVAGEKGGMVLVDADEMQRLVDLLPDAPAMAPGGSSANTTRLAAQLGLRATYVGKVGQDATAAAYVEQLGAAGLDTRRFKRAALPNARCLSLVTPDSQRTMRTCLGAAMTLGPGEISPADFAGARHAHIEGYLLFNPALADAVIAAARTAGCTVSVDLASFEVVRAARDWIMTQLGLGIDLVFGNEDEVRALFGDTEDYATLAQRLASYGGIAGVKLGKDGAWVARGRELHRVAPVAVTDLVDTTGAGDAWAAGFLFGHLRGWSLPACGALASLMGAETVRHLGPSIAPERWPAVQAQAAALGR